MMRFIVSILLCFLFLGNGISQENNRVYALSIMPHYSDIIDKEASLFNDYKGKISAAAAFELYLPIKDNVSLLLGLGYFNIGEKLTDKDVQDGLRWPSQHNGQGGFDPSLPGGTISPFVWRNNSHFLQVPIGLKFGFGKNNSLYSKTSIVTLTSLFGTSRTKNETSQGTVREHDWYKQNYLRQPSFFLQTALGKEMNIGKNVFFIEPSIYYTPFQINKKNAAGQENRLFGFGINLGFFI